MSDSQLLSLIVLIEWLREQSEVELVGDVSRGRREGVGQLKTFQLPAHLIGEYVILSSQLKFRMVQ